MYIFINRGLGMSSGKIAAQSGHAAVEAYRISGLDAVHDWYRGGHYTKLVMLARDEQHIQNIQDYLTARGFKSSMIIDEGLTEVDRHVKTALGVEIVDRDNEDVRATFSSFELYKDTITATINLER